MKRLMLAIALLVSLSGGALFAQDITGTWQGTLNVGRELRTVIKISNEGGAFKALLYSIDQGGQAIPGTVTVQGTSVRIAIPGIGGSYEGKFVEQDGTTITGTFTQGGQPVALNLKRATPTTAWVIPDAPVPPKPMSADANPVFEAATIKPSTPGAPGIGFRVNGRQFSTLNTTLIDLMTFAFGIHAKQITGMPSWVESEKFDLLARPDGEGQPNDKQWKTMLQKLLADRFQLKFHREKKELAAYGITSDKTPHKLTKSAGDPNGLPGLFFRGLGNLTVRNATIMDFAGLMQATVLDRPVVDQTELPGRWDFTLVWTPDEFQFNGAGARGAPPQIDGTNAPDLFSAMKEQLGLKIEATKAPVEVLVVDAVQKPSEN